jgi:hypothetical protein
LLNPSESHIWRITKLGYENFSRGVFDSGAAIVFRKRTDGSKNRPAQNADPADLQWPITDPANAGVRDEIQLGIFRGPRR